MRRARCCTKARFRRATLPSVSLPASTQTLTFLFTDIEGSTPLWDRDAEAMRRATVRHNALLREAIAAHGGDAFRVVGDAFCVAFANAGDAVLAAIDAQRSMTHEDWKGAFIRVRMGIHSGTAEAADDEIFRGPALARAARVMAAGHGEQVLLTAATVTLLDGKPPPGTSLRDLGDHTLRGFARAERLYQLIVPGLRTDFPPLATREALRTNLPPSLTTFVGRERALADVRAHARSERMVTLVGAGGTGKTRLMLEAAAELTDTFTDGVWFCELEPLTDGTQSPRPSPQRFARGRKGMSRRWRSWRTRSQASGVYCYSITANTSSTTPRESRNRS